LNAFGRSKTPCFFLIDFDAGSLYVEALDELQDIYLKVDDFRNYTKERVFFDSDVIADKKFIDFETYKHGFDQVKREIQAGNTYLLNLTYPTKITLNYSLQNIFKGSDAKFKLLFKDKFLSFSPERFIRIIGNRIETHPMKGTIDASIPNAQEKILANQKEMAEHTMVVDLLRNDLSRIAQQVRVKEFRYVDKIKAGQKELLQVSSHIEGVLDEHWQENLGSLLKELLPAGSITGAPKVSTTRIIHDVELIPRDFYSGIFGIYRENFLDSGVLIRYIEKRDNGYLYKSGGGITWDSNIYDEYEELKDKVYVPIF
jgi:para-aminobenzoate synthetase component 1